MTGKIRIGARSCLPALPLLALLLSGCVDLHRTPPSRIYYRGPVSDHFDGQHFFNPEGNEGTGGARRDGAGTFLKIATGKAGHHGWPKTVPVVQTVPPRRVEGEAMRVTWVGHATTLVQTQGLNILFDPVWAMRDSPVQMVGPRRVRRPGVRLEDLPPIDMVMISHNHYDHLDIRALKYLARRDHPKIIVGLGNDTLLAQHGLKATAGDWGQSIPIRGNISVEIMRAHHWSAHWIDDIDRALWCGFRVTLPGGDLYYSGDTGVGKMEWARQAVTERPIRFAILPIAPYKVATPATGNHIDPDQAVTAFELLHPGYALGVHWGTFELGEEPLDDAPVRLRTAMAHEHLDPERFRTLEAGASWDVPAMPAASGIDAAANDSPPPHPFAR